MEAIKLPSLSKHHERKRTGCAKKYMKTDFFTVTFKNHYKATLEATECLDQKLGPFRLFTYICYFNVQNQHKLVNNYNIDDRRKEVTYLKYCIYFLFQEIIKIDTKMHKKGYFSQFMGSTQVDLTSLSSSDKFPDLPLHNSIPHYTQSQILEHLNNLETLTPQASHCAQHWMCVVQRPDKKKGQVVQKLLGMIEQRKYLAQLCISVLVNHD